MVSVPTPGTPANLEEHSVKAAYGWCLLYVTWHCGFRSACCLSLDHHCLSFEVNCPLNISTTLFGASSESRGRWCLMGRGTLVCCTSTSHADIIPGEVHHNGSLAWTGPCCPLNLLTDISVSSAFLFTIQTISLKDQKKKSSITVLLFLSEEKQNLNAMGHAYIYCLPIKSISENPISH